MPRKPMKSKRGRLLTGTTETHLLAGYCLLDCDCQVCDQKTPASLLPNAHDTWQRHRKRLLAIWRDPDGRCAGSGFSAEGLRGAGRLGLPCWAEIVFEGAKVPKFDRTWPDDVKKIYRELKEFSSLHNRPKGKKENV